MQSMCAAGTTSYEHSINIRQNIGVTLSSGTGSMSAFDRRECAESKAHVVGLNTSENFITGESEWDSSYAHPGLYEYGKQSR